MWLPAVKHDEALQHINVLSHPPHCPWIGRKQRQEKTPAHSGVIIIKEMEDGAEGKSDQREDKE